MVDHSSVQIPPPSNWQDFEHCTRILFECLLGDPNTQLNGRTGQSQCGVDVFGQRLTDEGHWVGVQCKGKDSGYGGFVSESELRKEVNKAKSFEPPIKEFILVTTARNDVSIQQVARILTDELQQQDQSFTVSVWGWEEIQSRIVAHPDALAAFHPDQTLYTDVLIGGQDELKEGQAKIGVNVENVLARVVSLEETIITIAEDRTTVADETIDKILHREIDEYRDLFRSGNPRTALGSLSRLMERLPKSASNRVRFRLHTNIGAAKFCLGDEEGAAQYYLSAIEFDPDDKLGRANVILAHLIRGDTPKAIETGRKALEDDPTNEYAAAYLAQACVGDATMATPDALIPEDLLNNEDVIIGRIAFHRWRNNPEWRELALQQTLNDETSTALKRFIAEAVLDKLFEMDGYAAGAKPLGDQPQIPLEDVADILSEIWEKDLQSDAAPRDSALPKNLAHAKFLQAKLEEAHKIANRALEYFPEDLALLKLDVVSGSDLEQQVNSSSLSKIENDDEGALISAEEWLSTGQHKQALQILENHDWGESPEPYRLRSRILAIECQIAAKEETQGIVGSARSLLADFPDSPIAYCLIDQALQGSSIESDEDPLTDAIEAVSDRTAFVEILQLCKSLFRKSRFQDVCDLLEDKVDFTRDSGSLRLLLSAAINAARRNLTSSILDNIINDVAEDPFYQRIRAVHLMNVGDLKTAGPIVEKYLAQRPKDLELTYFFVTSCIRQGDEQKAAEILEGDLSHLEGPAILKMQLCLLFSRFGHHDNAMKMGYGTLLENIRDPSVLEAYAGLVFSISKKAPRLFEKDEVEIDAAFTIQDGDENHTLIIEPDPTLRSSSETVSPDHKIATAAQGLKVGETFSTSSRMGTETTWTVTQIVHKYLKQHYSILEHFSTQFPGQGGPERIKMEANDPKPILDSLDRRQDSVKTGFEQYASSNLPLRFLGRILGGDPIETYHGLLRCGRQFKVAIGTAEERHTAIASVRGSVGQGCIIDALTLSLIIRLNIFGAVRNLFGDIGITQSTRDIFLQRLEEIKAHEGDTFTVMYAQDGKYFWDERTPEQVHELITIAQSDLDFITSNCGVLPATGVRDVSPKYNEVMRDVDATFFDDALASQGSGRILLVEDFGYRVLGASEFSINTTWLQPTLMVCHEKELVSDNEYIDSIINLCEAGHDYISVDARILLRASSLDPANQRDRFEAVLSSLSNPNADLPSHFKVYAQFLRVIWASRPTDLKTAVQTGMVLDRIMQHAGTDALGHIGVLKGMIPRIAIGFHEYVKHWCVGHFLVSQCDISEARARLT